MDFIKILLSRSKWLYVGLALLSAINGLLNMGLIAFINNSIAETPLPFDFKHAWIVFILMILVAFLTNKVFQTYMIKLTTSINYEFEIAILQKLRKASLQDFEKLGNERVFTAMGDIRNLSDFPEVLMSALNSFIVVTCCFVYLFFISTFGALSIISIMAILLIIYVYRNGKIEQKLQELRELQNNYFRYLTDLLAGFKEVKMSSVRNQNIYDRFLKQNRSTSKEISLQTGIGYMYNELTGNFSWYIVLGFIIFVLPLLLELKIADVSSFIVIILFLMGPIAILITLIPTFTRIKIAISRLNEFDHLINESVHENSLQTLNKREVSTFYQINFENVTYSYSDQKDNLTFEFGPIDLQIKKGELIFITGGNGSGKSTFVNLLTGLYTPTSGTIQLDNVKVDSCNIAYYKDHIAAIFTNPHLFKENYDGFEIHHQNESLKEFIGLMRLKEVLRIDQDHNKIDTNLSKGQQKRLAMIYAMLEDKPILVLDEWAAEQDPEFRAFFYQKFLPDLIRKGKTVIAITHDDTYFEYAGRLLKFEFGKMKQIEPLIQVSFKK